MLSLCRLDAVPRSPFPTPMLLPRPFSNRLTLSSAFVLFALASPAALCAQLAAPSHQTEAAGMIRQYCWNCHGDRSSRGGISFTSRLGDDGLGNKRDSDGYLVQATYTIKATKLGVNYGVSKLDFANAADEATTPNLLEKNSKVTVGVYHTLTKNLTLIGEFSDVKTEAHNGDDNRSNNFNVGAYLSF